MSTLESSVQPESRLPEGAERRGEPRIPSQRLRMGGPWAAVLDLSLSGAGLIVETPLQPGARCELVLVEGLLKTRQQIRAEVVWCRGGRAGLRWIDLTDDQRRWLRDCFAAWPAVACAALLKPSTP